MFQDYMHYINVFQMKMINIIIEQKRKSLPALCLAALLAGCTSVAGNYPDTDFGYDGNCASCHSGPVVSTVHGGTCDICHTDPANNDYSRRDGSGTPNGNDGDARLAGTDNTATCTVCHPNAATKAGLVAAVKSLAQDFPEKKQRRRKWFSPKKAALRVSEPELARILRDFDPRMLR